MVSNQICPVEKIYDCAIYDCACVARRKKIGAIFGKNRSKSIYGKPSRRFFPPRWPTRWCSNRQIGWFKFSTHFGHPDAADALEIPFLSPFGAHPNGAYHKKVYYDFFYLVKNHWYSAGKVERFGFVIVIFVLYYQLNMLTVTSSGKRKKSIFFAHK